MALTEEKDNIISINGTDYKQDDLTDQQRYMIAQIKDCQSRTQQAQMAADRERAALDAFTNALVQSLEEQPKEVIAS